METPGKWGSWTHDTPQDDTPEAQGDNVYQMYPIDWSRASDEQRDAEEARQRRNRYTNGGLGYATDYGVDYQSERVVPSRPISAATAAFESVVKLG